MKYQHSQHLNSPMLLPTSYSEWDYVLFLLYRSIGLKDRSIGIEGRTIGMVDAIPTDELVQYLPLNEQFGDTAVTRWAISTVEYSVKSLSEQTVLILITRLTFQGRMCNRESIRTSGPLMATTGLVHLASGHIGQDLVLNDRNYGIGITKTTNIEAISESINPNLSSNLNGMENR